MTRRLIYSFAVILLAAVFVYADPPVTAQIPFSFYVGDSTLPSGVYTVDTNVTAAGVLCLRSANGRSSVMSLSQHVRSSTGPAQAKLIFHKYGDRYFLAGMELAGSHMTLRLPEGKVEAELRAQNTTGTEEILLAWLQ